MSLYKQLISVLSLFLIIMMSSILWFILDHNKTLIENQLSTNAKNSASFLGLSISKNDTFFDTVQMEGMISAVIDNGYYEYISVIDSSEREIVKESSTIENSTVPSWFSSFYKIDTDFQEATIMQGWLNVGVIRVKVDQAYANEKMWATFLSLSKIFAISTLVLLFLIYFTLEKLLQPLEKLKIQAKAIDNNEFIIEQNLPKTNEFKDVVMAMNKTISKMEYIFNKEAETLKKYNELYYKDEDTGFGNRNYLLLKLNTYLKNSQGILFFLAVKNDNSFKKKIGFTQYNKFRKFLISNLTDRFSYNHDLVLSKLEDGTFCGLLPNESYLDIKTLIDEMYVQIEDYVKKEELDKVFDTKISIGIANYTQNNTVRDIMSKTDQALTLAEEKDKRIYYLEEDVAFTKDEWIEKLQWALKNDALSFNVQDVMNLDENKIYMREYFTKLVNKDNTTYSSGYFISLITAMGWMHDFDKHMISKIFKENSQAQEENNVVINLSIDFVRDEDSVDWLMEKLITNFKSSNTKFYFECINADVQRNLKYMEKFVNKLSLTEHKFAIESFTYDNDNLDYLKDLKPAYIKISKSYLLGDTNSIGESSLMNIVSTIGAELMVKHVETKAEVDALKEKGIKFIQGRYFDELKEKNK